jgi:rRNA-processing protein FCF1
MRHGRAKQARKTLQFFERTVGIRSPYHILLDGTFIVAVIKYKVPLADRLDTLLQHSAVSLYVCASTVTELHTLLSSASTKNNTTDHAEIFRQAIEWCSTNCQLIHTTEPSDVAATATTTRTRVANNTNLSTAAADIRNLVVSANTATTSQTTTATTESAVSNTNSSSSGPQHHHRRYFCASQDEDLLDACRHAATVPLIRLARGSVLLLEQPSKFASRADTHKEKTKWKSGTVSTAEQQLVDLVVQQQKEQQRKNKTNTTKDNAMRSVRKPKKAKGPNPLSCKKRVSSEQTSSTKRKRQRKTTTTSNASASVQE